MAQVEVARAAARRAHEGFLGASLSPIELERTAILFGLLFVAAFVLVVGRSARDALFLTRFPVSWVGPMWIAYAAVSVVAALGYARLARRVPRVPLVLGFCAVSAVSYLVLRWLVALDLATAFFVLAVWSEVVANFSAVLVWALAEDLHDARSAKRLFGFIGAGRILGIALSGLSTGSLVRVVGTEGLLVVLAVALVGMAGLTLVLARRHPAPPRAPEEGEPAAAPPPRAVRTPYVLSLAALTLLLFAAVTIGDYQFKAIARSVHPERDELASFLGLFYAGVGAFGLAVQLGVSRRLLSRFGVAAGMLVMPAAYLAATAALLASPGLLLAAMMKGSDNGLQYTLQEATQQILFYPFTAEARERVRTWISAVCKPLGCGIGAGLLLWLVPPGQTVEPGASLVASAARLGLWTLPLCALALGLVPVVRRGYIDAMRRSLARREIEPAGMASGPTVRALLRGALASDSFAQVLFAVDRLREIEPSLVREALPRLAGHRSQRVRALALRLSTELDDPRAADLARPLLRDVDADVRVAAVQAIADQLREDAHDELSTLARSPDIAVRNAAIAALVSQCGLDGMLDGAPMLRALLDGPDPAGRAEAARVLGLAGRASLQRALARLIADEDAAVRSAAIEAASTVRDVRLAPLLADALADRALSAAAARALAGIGEPAVAELEARLASPSTPRQALLTIPRVLWRIGGERALGALLTCLEQRDEVVRQKVLASASRLRLALHAPALDAAVVRARIERELDDHVATRDGYLAVRARVGRPLLEEHWLARLRKGLIRILRLCELAYPRDVVASVRTHLFGGDAGKRANAFEVLESLLEPAVREKLVELVERFLELNGRRQNRGSIGVSLLPAPASAGAGVAWLEAEVRSGDPWRAMLALDAAAHHRVRALGRTALAATRDPDPMVREAGGIAAVALAADGYRDVVAGLFADEDATVAHWARYWTQTGHSGIDPEDAMYTTIEKVLFLQRVPVFSRVAGDDLVALAHGSAVVPMQPGDVVFREGEPGGSLYFVVSGSVVLTVQGREVARLGESDVFGELSIFDREKRAVTAIVSDEAELLRVSAEDFHAAVRETVEIAEGVIQVLNRRLREADRRLANVRASRTPLPPRGAPASEPLPEPASGEVPPATASMREREDEVREAAERDLE
jgi:CRP-like cAMP-binding protein/HEAT repeat protein